MDRLLVSIYVFLLIYKVSVVVGQILENEDAEKSGNIYLQNGSVTYHNKLSALFHTVEVKRLATTQHANLRRALIADQHVNFITSLDDHNTITTEDQTTVEGNSVKTTSVEEASGIETTLRETPAGITSSGNSEETRSMENATATTSEETVEKTTSMAKFGKSNLHTTTHLNKNATWIDLKEANKTDVGGPIWGDTDDSGLKNVATNYFQEKVFFSLPVSFIIIKCNILRV